MIEVSVREDGITVSGHAGYAKSGKDIVCSAVTTLVQTFVGSIESLTKDKMECKMSAGMADVRYKNLSEQGKLLVDSFFIGILMIADEFPDYIRVR